MLEKLETVPWHTLTHAYGEASDVPELLRQLADGYDSVLTELFGNIYHQGTVYEATAKAVPFLVEILDAPDTDAIGILQLLHAIANGTSYHDVHRRLMPAADQESEETRRRVTIELGWVSEARRAVSEGYPVYLRKLGSEDEDVRAAAAQALGDCTRSDLDPDQRALVRAELSRLVAKEDSAMVRAGLIFAARGLWSASELATSLRDDAAAPRIAAALAIKRQNESEGLVEEALRVIPRDLPEAYEDLKDLPMQIDEPLSWVISEVDAPPDLGVSWVEGWSQHPDAEIRKSALWAADTLIQASRSATLALIPTLVRCGQDGSREVKRSAIRLLASVGSAAAPATELAWQILSTERLQHNQPSAHALKILARLGDARAASFISGTLEALMSRPPPVKLADGLGPAIEFLGPWAPECFEPLVRLIPVVASGNPKIAVISAVGRYGHAASAAVGALRSELSTHPHISTRVLGDLGPRAQEALEDLRALLGHADGWVRGNAARAVFRITGDAKELAKSMREMLGSDGHIRSHTLEIIAEAGPPLEELAAELPRFFHDESDWLSARSCAAYFSLTGDSASVLPILLHRHLVCAPVGEETVRWISRMGKSAEAALPRLRELVASDRRASNSSTADAAVEADESFRRTCEEAIRAIQLRRDG